MIHEISPHEYRVEYKPIKPRKDAVFLIYQGNKVFMELENGVINYPTLKDLQEVYPKSYDKAKFLFRIDNQDYYEIRSFVIEPFKDFDYYDLNELRSTTPTFWSFAGVTGAQIHQWYTDTTYCGRCGTKLKAKGDERAMICPSPMCQKVYYPTIAPSVIVGITSGNKLLLTKYAKGHTNRYRRYALVAGYTEVGETLEDTVRREVMEEVGLRVKNIWYYKSQPWSFSGTLLAGFFCEVDGDEVVSLDKTELSEGTWFERKDIPKTQSNISLTNEMIEYFRHHPEVFSK